MRKYTLRMFAVLTGSGLLFLLPGCLKDKVTKTYTIVTPVYTTKSTVIANINGSASEPIGSIGRIYIKDQFIYLNEPDKGIHIIDNTNPASPRQIAFLNIPGNQEVAIKGNTLYADMYRDLMAIDISDPHQIKVTGTAHEVFLDRYEDMTGYTTVNGGIIVDSSYMLTGYVKRDTTLVTNAPEKEMHYIMYNSPYYYTLASAASSSSTSNSGSGIAGSMAKMVLMNNYLYTISEPHQLGIVDVSNTPVPKKLSSSFAGFDLETIYPFNDKLFLGSQEGMYIYDVSNPTQPTAMGTFTHGRACDPVVADGSYAYVTLHSGTWCGGSSNELDVVNVQNLLQPVMTGTYPMTSPQGLCKDNNLLFVCDAGSGIALYDAGNPAALKLLTHLDIEFATDLIAINQRLFAIADGKLYQYDYSDVRNIRLISTFSVK